MQHPHDPINECMDHVVAALVLDVVHTSLATQCPMAAATQNQLEAALTQYTSYISGMELNSLISWSGVRDIEELSPSGQSLTMPKQQACNNKCSHHSQQKNFATTHLCNTLSTLTQCAT